MHFRSFFALLAGVLLVAGPRVQADYVLTTSDAGPYTFGSNTSTVTMTGVTSPTQTGASDINIENISLASMAPSNMTDTGMVNFSFTMGISQTPGSGSTTSGTASDTVTGSLLFLRSDVNGEISVLNNFSITPLTIGLTTYSVSDVVYAPPTVNGGVGNGSISVLITPTFSAVPLPPSLILVGSGTVSAFGFSWRRPRKARQNPGFSPN